MSYLRRARQSIAGAVQDIDWTESDDPALMEMRATLVTLGNRLTAHIEQSPCRLWEHDGYVHCSTHGATAPAGREPCAPLPGARAPQAQTEEE